MVSEDIKQLEFKIDLLLKAFLSFYGGDDSTYYWDTPFDHMKNEIIPELVQILELDEGDEVRKSFIESFGVIPSTSQDGEREWWTTCMTKILKSESDISKVIEAISKSASAYNQPFSDGIYSVFREVVRNGELKEISAVLEIYWKRTLAGESSILDKQDWIALSQHPVEAVRLAAVKAIAEWITKVDNYYVTKEKTQGMLSFCNDTSEKVNRELLPLIPKLIQADMAELQSLLSSKSDKIRYIALASYLGYDVARDSWTSQMGKPDLKIVAKFASDPSKPISKLAEAYLDRAQSSRRR